MTDKRVSTGTEQFSDANTLSFVFDNLISSVRTMTLCKVIAVNYPADSDRINGTVDVQPLINEVDIDGNVKELPAINNAPFWRYQGGNNSVIIDPVVGDIGIIAVSDRDMTNAVITKKVSNPDSNRKYSFSDSVYLGGILNSNPTQYVEFTNNSINIVTPATLNIKADTININASNVSITASSTSIDSPVSIKGETNITGNLTVSGNITGANVSATSDVSDSAGKLSDLRSSYNTHKHPVSGVETGGSTVTSGTPTN